MACEITSGFTQSCQYRLGGISDLWLQNYSKLPSSAVTYSSTGQVTGATLTSGSWLKYEVVKNTSAFNEEEQFGDVARFWQQTLSFSLATGTDAQADRNQAELLGLGKLVAIIKTRTGNYLLAGWTNPLEPSAGTAGTGQAETDTDGYTFTFLAPQTGLAPTIGSSVTGSLPTA